MCIWMEPAVVLILVLMDNQNTKDAYTSLINNEVS